MARTKALTEWWKLSCSGNANERKEWRYLVKLMLDPVQEWWFAKGRPIREPLPPITAIAYEDGPVEDMPWGENTLLLVSDRLRQLFEREAPGHAEFFPATILTTKKRPVRELAPFWAMNILRIIDCTHYEASEYTTREEPDGSTFYSFDVHVTDSSKIPDDVVMTRILQFPNIVLVRDSVRRAVLDAGMTGCQFYQTAVR